MRKKINKDFSQRLRALRGYLSLSRSEIEQKYGIKVISYSLWESGKSEYINDVSIKKLMNLFRNEGIECSEEWLIEGKGPSPFKDLSKNNFSSSQQPSDINAIEQEKTCFLNSHKNAIAIDVLNDDMAPYYYQGDLVGGVKIDTKNYPDFIGFPCIITDKNNIKSIKKFSIFNDNLIFYSEKDSHKRIKKAFEEFIDIYEIIWHRTPKSQ